MQISAVIVVIGIVVVVFGGYLVHMGDDTPEQLIAGIMIIIGIVVAIGGGIGLLATWGQDNDTTPRGTSGTAVTQIVLRNGVHCAFMDGPNNKALDCDWKGQRSEPTNVDPKGDHGTTVTVVNLDGKDCAVADATNGKAISCNW